MLQKPPYETIIVQDVSVDNSVLYHGSMTGNEKLLWIIYSNIDKFHADGGSLDMDFLSKIFNLSPKKIEMMISSLVKKGYMEKRKTISEIKTSDGVDRYSEIFLEAQKPVITDNSEYYKNCSFDDILNII